MALSKGEAAQVLRTSMRLEERNILGAMPSSISSKNIVGAKILTIFPNNFNKGLPSHQGLVIVFETETGSLKAIVEGEAIRLVRNIEYVTVWDINLESAEKYSKEISERFKIPVRVCKTLEEAVREADIICTVTAAKEPIMFGRHVKKGAHINAVGACTRDCRELDTMLVKNSKF
ncbi:ornithine cyclodeaminase family protein [Clostridium sp.]|uniref:ornithine cyclodeaminase family protein n=1 Tax=Clostridium sp. TaxID=1506 RepID=UPI003F4C4107